MEGAALLGGLAWRRAHVVGLRDETPRVRTLFLDVPGWPGHLPGQHVDVRLTAEDGYQAQRAYSIASAPGDAALALTVERLEDGEVSPYLTRDVRAGDLLEVRGPLGRYFIWEASMGGPLLLLAGGSGVVPLMAMLRYRANQSGPPPTRLLYSSRTPEDVIYRDELDRLQRADTGLAVVHTFTRGVPPGWTGFSRRIDREMVTDVAWPADRRALAYVCGPSGFVEAGSATLDVLGYARSRIRTERFGPSGT